MQEMTHFFWSERWKLKAVMLRYTNVGIAYRETRNQTLMPIPDPFLYCTFPPNTKPALIGERQGMNERRCEQHERFVDDLRKKECERI
jgi:hypothetical protein